MPQYKILGGDSKFEELKGEDGRVQLDKIEDPYLKYGGAYLGDVKDTPDFKYLTFDKVPTFSEAHRSLMSKTLTPELFEKLKDVKSSKGYTLSNVIMTGKSLCSASCFSSFPRVLCLMKSSSTSSPSDPFTVLVLCFPSNLLLS